MIFRTIVCAVLAAAACQAEPYWVSWTGTDYPENQGWTRYSSDPAAQRWLEDGKLFIDSRGGRWTYDECGQSRAGLMTPGPGETFEMRWRLKVDEVAGGPDPGVYVRSDDGYDVFFLFRSDSMDISCVDVFTLPLEAGLFHSFVFSSSDARTFSLSVDGGAPVSSALFDGVFTGPLVAWGDMTTNASLAEWDYFEYGIVPEPATALCWLAPVICARRRIA